MQKSSAKYMSAPAWSNVLLSLRSVWMMVTNQKEKMKRFFTITCTEGGVSKELGVYSHTVTKVTCLSAIARTARPGEEPTFLREHAAIDDSGVGEGLGTGNDAEIFQKRPLHVDNTASTPSYPIHNK